MVRLVFNTREINNKSFNKVIEKKYPNSKYIVIDFDREPVENYLNKTKGRPEEILDRRLVVLKINSDLIPKFDASSVIKTIEELKLKVNLKFLLPENRTIDKYNNLGQTISKNSELITMEELNLIVENIRQIINSYNKKDELLKKMEHETHDLQEQTQQDYNNLMSERRNLKDAQDELLEKLAQIEKTRQSESF